jgi:hypothetical protein
VRTWFFVISIFLGIAVFTHFMAGKEPYNQSASFKIKMACADYKAWAKGKIIHSWEDYCK